LESDDREESVATIPVDLNTGKTTEDTDTDVTATLNSVNAPEQV
jgi:hypothetical protein